MAICERCGKQFITPTIEGNWHSNRFCSKSCANSRRITEEQKIKTKITKEKNNYPKIQNKLNELHICEGCGKEFTFKEFPNAPKSGRFCSRSCANKRIITEERKLNVSNKIKNLYCEHPEKRLLSSIRAKEWHSKNKVKLEKHRDSLKVDWICPVCGKVLKLTKLQASKRKYCNGTCRNIATNKYKNGSISKAELILKDKLLKTFPNLTFKFNNREILNGLELDVYIEELKYAVEWNGIYHYKDVHGTLEKVQKKDQLKVDLCKQKGIKLTVIKDLQSSNKSIQQGVSIIIQEIKSLLEII